MTTPRATIREVDGKLILDDPDALSMIRAIGKINCEETVRLHADRIEHFKRRFAERGDDPKAVMITLINVDDPSGAGAVIADALMPGHDWQSYRDRGEVPFARGLAGRTGLQEMLDAGDPDAGAELRAVEGVALLVVDHGVVVVFGVEGP